MKRATTNSKVKVADLSMRDSALRRLKSANELKEKQDYRGMLREVQDAISLLGRSGAEIEYRIEALLLESYAYDRLSEYPKAKETASQAIEFARRPSISMKYKADANLQFAWVQIHMDNHLEAIKYLEQSLSMYERIKDPEGIGNSCRMLGAAYADILNFGKSMAYSVRAARIFEDLKMESKRMVVIYNMAIHKTDQGLYTDALRDFEDCLRYFQDTNNEYMLCRTYHRIGMEYLLIDKWDKAIENLGNADEYAKKTGDTIISELDKCYLIEAYLGKDDLQQSEVRLHESSTDLLSSKSIETRVSFLKARALFLTEKGQYAQAEKDFKESERMAIEHDMWYKLPTIYIDWAKASLKTKKMVKANLLFGKARMIFQKYNLRIREAEMDEIIRQNAESQSKKKG